MKRDDAHWILLLASALYVRLAWIPCLWGERHLAIFHTDALYHLRQIRWGARQFPFLPIHDTYLSPPDGGLSPWPGGFDWIWSALLALAKLAGLEGPVQEEAFVALLVSALGLAGVVLCILVARRMYGPIAGWIAGWLFALSPAFVDVSRFGRVDHHVLEPIILLFGLHRGISPRLRGFFLGASLVISQSALIPVVLVAVVVLSGDLYLRRVRELQAPTESTVLARSTIVSAVPLILLVCMVRGIWFDYRFVTLFHLGVLGLWWFAAEFLSRPERRLRVLFGLAFLCLSAVLSLPFLESIYLLWGNPVIQMAAEARPGLSAGLLKYGYLSDNIFLWPVACVFFLWINRKRRFEFRRDLEMSILSLICAGLLFSQLRFAPLAAVPLVLSVAGLLGRGLTDLRTWIRKRLQLRPWLAGFLVVLLTGGWVVFSHRSFARDLVRPRCGRTKEKLALIRTMEWLRRNTNDPGHAGNPTIQPRYSVLAPWHLGHHIIYWAQRPAVVTPFIFGRDTPGLETSVRFFFLDSTDEAIGRAITAGVRYVLLPDLFRQAPSHVFPFDPKAARAFAEELQNIRKPRYSQTMAQCLWQENLISARRGSLQLAYEARSARTSRVFFRVFRLEPGPLKTD